jgi:phage FluMu protein Com
VTHTCLDCVNLDLDRIPTEGHPCHDCDGKLMALRVNGSGWIERNCGNCKHSTVTKRCELRVLEASRAHTVAGTDMYEFFREFKDPCVDYSAWRKSHA